MPLCVPKLVDDSIISAIPLLYISACRHIFVNGLGPADIATNERFIGDITSTFYETFVNVEALFHSI